MQACPNSLKTVPLLTLYDVHTVCSVVYTDVCICTEYILVSENSRGLNLSNILSYLLYIIVKIVF